MSTTADSRRIKIDLCDGFEKEVPDGEPATGSLEIAYNDGGNKTVSIDYGQEEWILEFNAEGQCVDRDPLTRLLFQWISNAAELMKWELQ